MLSCEARTQARAPPGPLANLTYLLLVVTYNVVSQVTRRRGLERNVTQDAWQVGLDRSHVWLAPKIYRIFRCPEYSRSSRILITVFVIIMIIANYRCGRTKRFRFLKFSKRIQGTSNQMQAWKSNQMPGKLYQLSCPKKAKSK